MFVINKFEQIHLTLHSSLFFCEMSHKVYFTRGSTPKSRWFRQSECVPTCNKSTLYKLCKVELINGMFSFMGQNVLCASRKQFHVHDWERGRERWTEKIWGFMREKQGREESSTQQFDSLKWTYEEFNQWLRTHISTDIVYKPDVQKEHSTHMPESPQKASL